MSARRWLPWLVLGVVLVAALVVGARSPGAPTDAERVQAIAETVRCPRCDGQSVAGSEAPSARSVRQDIERRVAEGESDDEVREALAASYGSWILMNPPRDGVAGLVWVLPVVALVAAVTGLVVAFRRWRADVPDAPATDADRALVEQARRRSAP